MIYTNLWEMITETEKRSTEQSMSFTPEELRFLRRGLMYLSDKTWDQCHAMKDEEFRLDLRKRADAIDALLDRVDGALSARR